MEAAPHATPERVLYVITKANWGGAQRYVYDLALGARDAGYAVAVAVGTDGELCTRLETAGIRTIRVPMRNAASLGALVGAYRSLLPLLRDEQPAIVHLNSSLAGAAGAYAARRAGIRRIIFTAHGWAFNELRPLWQKGLIWLIHTTTVLLSHVTICVSEAIHRDARTMPFTRSTLRVVHNGIDAAALRTRDEARAALAPDLSALLWIGTIAELHPTKQIQVAIEAFARLSLPHAALIVMGEGPERARLEALAAARGVADRVRLVGHVPDAAHYLPALDVFVLPSRSEALGYVVLEAGRAALSVVASDVGGIPEIVRHQESGLLVPAGDAAAFSDAIGLLLDNAELRTSLGTALRERVTRVFPLSRMIRETLSLYAR